MDSKTFIEIFKLAPAIVALLAAIYMLYRLLLKKEETLKEVLSQIHVDIEREARLMTLLEILVHRGKEKA